MNIDRHNYEEHFILYWDNELTVSQKQAVENFIKENPDLQEEFKLLGETRFTPDDHVQIKEKEFLLNNSFINITNYEEQLLNYIDDEVTADEKKEVEKFVNQYSAVKQELALLQKTKLQPEAEIAFPDKSVLYRREEKVRVISMTWFRVAVAAAIIFIAGFATFRIVQTNNKGGEVVTTTPKKSNSPIDSLIDSPINEPLNAKLNQGIPSVQPDIKKKNQKPVIENKIANTIASNKIENKNNLPKERKINDKPIVDPNESKGDIAFIPKANNKAQEFESNNTIIDNPSVTKSSPISFAKVDESGYDDNLGKKEKGGIKEFLRKTTRVFERRTKIQTTTDDNKLLLGAFAVSLK